MADEKVVRQRLEKRSEDASARSDAGWAVYEAQKATFEPIAELDAWRHITVDTGQPAERSLNNALRALDARLSPAGVE
jgi:predicted kinase